MRKNQKTKAFVLGLGLAIILISFIVIPVISHGGLICQAQAADKGTTTVCGCTGDAICLNVWIGEWCVDGLAEYITIFYRYFMGIIGIFAVAMIMFGGFKWITASGNSEKINQAKDSITSAIIGVVIALISYVLLYTINPMITTLKLSVSDVTGTTESAYSQICEKLYGDGWQAEVGKDESFNAQCGDPVPINGDENNVCYGGHCADGQICIFSILNGYNCDYPERLCSDTDKNNCRDTDKILAREGSDKGCAKRVDANQSLVDLFGFEGEDECVYGPVITEEQWEQGGTYERVGCLEYAKAENICWGQYRNQRVPWCNFTGIGLPIVNLSIIVTPQNHCCTDSARPIAGANRVCLKKVGGNENDPDSYKLWEP